METPEYSLEELRVKFPAAASYLLNIFLIEREYGKVQNSQLARKMSVSKPAVNQAIGRMKTLGFVRQASYGEIVLTDIGKRIAAKILRKHYLAEYMLIKQLNYPWDKADEEARNLQEAISDDFTDYLFDFFGRPEVCPHGNPFPGSKSEQLLISAPRLHKAPPGTHLELIRITEEGEAEDGLLKFCNMHNLFPGTAMAVSRYLNDDSIEVKSGNSVIKLPLAFAAYLCYRVK
ncbi:MAG: metal-dependent transcriptional regulator [Spirochaetales bacterium]|nr:metal-dependent transcriptional regulator [Spirochaetales bacterium]